MISFLSKFLLAFLAYPAARIIGEGLNQLSSHNPIGAGVLGGLLIGPLFTWFFIKNSKE